MRGLIHRLGKRVPGYVVHCCTQGHAAVAIDAQFAELRLRELDDVLTPTSASPGDLAGVFRADPDAFSSEEPIAVEPRQTVHVSSRRKRSTSRTCRSSFDPPTWLVSRRAWTSSGSGAPRSRGMGRSKAGARHSAGLLGGLLGRRATRTGECVRCSAPFTGQRPPVRTVERSMKSTRPAYSRTSPSREIPW